MSSEEAREAAGKALELDPNFDQALCFLGYIYSDKRMFKEAVELHQKVSVVSPPWKWALVRTCAQAGRKAEAMKLLAEYLAGDSKPTATSSTAR